MTPPLFLVPDLGTGDTIELTGAEAHHAGTVKRLRVGETVLLADGSGGLAEATVTVVAKDHLSLHVDARRSVAEARPRFVVAQALPKGERADLAVELLTELGVDEIIPWSAARSVSVWKGEKAARGAQKWQRIALEAAKQSRRARVPMVSALAGTGQLTERIAAADLALLLDSDATDTIAELAGQVLAAPGRHSDTVPIADPAEVLLVVGPEGGLDPAELTGFIAAGARAGRLGPEVLRTSTAGGAALAVLSVALGRWR